MKKTGLLIFLFSLLVTGLAPGQAGADWNYTFEPKVSVREEYDSNIYFTEENEEDDFNTQVGVIFPFKAKTETTDLSLTYRTSYFKYGSNSDADFGEHFADLRIDHGLTRRLRVSLADAFSITEDSDRVLRSESDVGESGILVDRDKRLGNRVTGTVSYALTPRAALSLSANNAIYRYDFDDLYDSDTNGGSVTFNYTVSAKNSVFTSVSYSKGDYERDDWSLNQNIRYTKDPLSGDDISFFEDEFEESEYYGVYAGWTHHYSPTTTLSVYAGWRKTEDTEQDVLLVAGAGDVLTPNTSGLIPGTTVTDLVSGEEGTVFGTSPTVVTFENTQLVTQENTETNRGLVYNLTFNKEFRASRLSLAFSQDASTRSSGLGGTRETQNYTAKYDHRLTSRLSAFVKGRYYKNKSEGDFEDDYDTWGAGAGLKFAITRNLSSRLTYDYTEQERDRAGSGDTSTIDRNLVLLSFGYTWYVMR
ncbi:MAG: hypothetical protein R3231_04715 [bacterium]|nr:hypothetical protein [bacterium]